MTSGLSMSKSLEHVRESCCWPVACCCRKLRLETWCCPVHQRCVFAVSSEVCVARSICGETACAVESQTSLHVSHSRPCEYKAPREAASDKMLQDHQNTLRKNIGLGESPSKNNRSRLCRQQYPHENISLGVVQAIRSCVLFSLSFQANTVPLTRPPPPALMILPHTPGTRSSRRAREHWR